jgi:hypothetical protein
VYQVIVVVTMPSHKPLTYAPSVKHGARSSRFGIRSSGVVKTNGVKSEDMMQGSVVFNARVRNNEAHYRASKIPGYGPERTKRMWAPPSTDEQSFVVKTRQLGLCELNRGDAFRCTQNGGESTVIVHTNAAGLPRSTNLGMPVVVCTDAGPGLTDAVTVMSRGMVSVVYTASQTGVPGQQLLLLPKSTVSKSGEPGVQTAGVSKQHFPFTLEPQTNNTRFVDELILHEKLRKELHLDTFLTQLQKGLSQPKDQSLYIFEALKDMAVRVCEALQIFDPNPLRWSAVLHSAWRLLQFARTGAMVDYKGAARLRLRIILHDVLRRAIEQIAYDVTQHRNDYSGQLPHVPGSDQGDTASLDALRRCTDVNQYTGARAHSACELMDMIDSAGAQLELSHAYYAHLIAHDYHAFYAKFYFGTLLSTASTGQTADVGLGL